MTDSLPLRLSHLAARGNRNAEIVGELLGDLEPLKEMLEAITEGLDTLESGHDSYVDNDPSEATITDQREYAREARADAWDEIQTAADELAQHLDSFIEVLGLEPMK
jgi:hypothetical protein